MRSKQKMHKVTHKKAAGGIHMKVVNSDTEKGLLAHTQEEAKQKKLTTMVEGYFLERKTENLKVTFGR